MFFLQQNVVEKWAHKKYRSTRDYELRIMTLQNWAISLGRLLGPLRIVYAGALALRLGSFYTCVMTNLRDWIRVYLRFLLESAQSLNSNTTKMMQVRLCMCFSCFSRLSQLPAFEAHP
ncbi:unnamed protein product [Dibothriocephalus latus]|uniref:Uncharacterized protein n=1 Tax=Dibothriocephalus latus TaxID=60516 RepID=A0A3P7NAB1_DIBLA|nr:unnamed protein product [Dibothriocephalus latus]